MAPDDTAARRRALLGVVDSAQRAAGMLGARHRGDSEGALSLMESFRDDRELASGALLLAELSLGLVSHETHKPFEDCVRELVLQLEDSMNPR